METEDEIEEIDLVASGYDWDCPVCNVWNYVIQVEQEVECNECHMVFKVHDHYHAY